MVILHTSKGNCCIFLQCAVLIIGFFILEPVIAQTGSRPIIDPPYYPGRYGTRLNSPQAVCDSDNSAEYNFEEISDDRYFVGGGGPPTNNKIIYTTVGRCANYHNNGQLINSFRVKSIWEVYCPLRKAFFYNQPQIYTNFEDAVKDGYSCSLPPIQQCTFAGNPIFFTSGSKYQKELDYVGNSSFPIEFSRFYNTLRFYEFGTYDPVNNLQLRVWRYSYSELFVADESAGTAYMVAEDGNVYLFSYVNGSWVAKGGTQAVLVKINNNWEITLRTGLTHVFDETGQLTSRRDQLGRIQTINKTSEYLEIANWNGDRIKILYDEYLRPVQILNKNGNNVVSYTFTGYTSPGRLFETVSFSDGTVKEYRYDFENSRMWLSDILIDGTLTNHWEYDSQGRAIVSEHASGANRTTFDYTYINDSADPRTTVTNALGKSTTYHFSKIDSALKVTSVEGHASAGCAAANKSYTYYSNGLVETSTDWKGNVTHFTYNSLGLETQKIEAFGKAAERTTQTEWHPTLNRPTKIIEPGRETIFTYDSLGRVESKRIITTN